VDPEWVIVWTLGIAMVVTIIFCLTVVGIYTL
jgi:hypothetical protein